MKTQTDKTEKIQNLINNITRGAYDPNKLVELEESYNLTRKLLTYGREAVEPILIKLRTLKANRKLQEVPLALDHLVSVLLVVAEPQDAQALTNLLLWDEIILGSGIYAPMRGLGIVRTLKKIGNASTVSHLETLAERFKNLQLKLIDPTEDVLFDFRLYQQSIAEAIASCQSRPAPTT